MAKCQPNGLTKVAYGKRHCGWPFEISINCQKKKRLFPASYPTSYLHALLKEGHLIQHCFASFLLLLLQLSWICVADEEKIEAFSCWVVSKIYMGSYAVWKIKFFGLRTRFKNFHDSLGGNNSTFLEKANFATMIN